MATTEVFAGLQKLDRAQEEASLDLGANYWQTFWRITVPNLKLPIIGAALLIFTLSMDEIAVSFFLIGRDNTLPLEIWGRLRRGITPEINAVSTHHLRVFAGDDCGLVPAAVRRAESELNRQRCGIAELVESAFDVGQYLVILREAKELCSRLRSSSEDCMTSTAEACWPQDDI